MTANYNRVEGNMYCSNEIKEARQQLLQGLFLKDVCSLE